MNEQTEENLPKQHLTEILNRGRVQLYQGSDNHIHVYYNGFYRCVVSMGFWRDAEASLFETKEFLELRSAGAGVLRFPLTHIANAPLPLKDLWPTDIDENGVVLKYDDEDYDPVKNAKENERSESSH